jgi:DNA-binding transcriptional ArsR family regulator
MIEQENEISIVSRPMPTLRDATYWIRSDAQLRALASPVRQEVVDALGAAGPCTIAEIARHTARPADSLYFHVRRLLAVGLLVETGERRKGRHVAAVYDVPGRPLRIDHARVPSRESRRVLAAAIRLGGRDLDRSMAAGAPARAGRVKGWVGTRDLRRIERLVAELRDAVGSGRPGKGRAPYSFTFIFAPARVSPRAARTGDRS